METNSEIAKHKFNEGFNCAQACFYPFAIQAGIEPEHALKLTTGFGAGMVFRGEMCGAITGSMMAISLLHGRSKHDDYDSKDKTYILIKELHKQFFQLHGSIHCKDLLRLDNVEPESWEKAKDLFKTHCPLYVEDAARITDTILNSLK